jgi:S1-C subfamily serine protease
LEQRWATRLATVTAATLAMGTGIGFGLGGAARLLGGGAATAMVGVAAPHAGQAYALDGASGAIHRTSVEQDIIGVVRDVSPSVVTVMRDGGLGTGFVIDRNGLILTNAHVVGDAPTVDIKLKNARVLEGQVVGKDTTVDVAVVRVKARDLPAVQLGDSDHLDVGQTAIAIGNPLGLEQTVTTGVVSAINRKLSPDDVEGFIQTDATINPGNSGGPLLDSSGRVIGINAAVLRGNNAEGLGFAVPINVARDVARQLTLTGYVRRAVMGVASLSLTPEIQQRFDLPVDHGVIVSDVYPGSPAYAAGLRRGDIITTMDGHPISGTGDLLRHLRAKNPGDTVTVSGVGDAGPFQYVVRLAESDK